MPDGHVRQIDGYSTGDFPEDDGGGKGPPPRPTSLIARNVRVSGHRTSMRLEREVWSALRRICAIEDLTMGQLCTEIAEAKIESSGSLASAVRVYVLKYFMEAATPEGHTQVGHGARVLRQRT